LTLKLTPKILTPKEIEYPKRAINSFMVPLLWHCHENNITFELG